MPRIPYKAEKERLCGKTIKADLHGTILSHATPCTTRWGLEILLSSKEFVNSASGSAVALIAKPTVKTIRLVQLRKTKSILLRCCLRPRLFKLVRCKTFTNKIKIKIKFNKLHWEKIFASQPKRPSCLKRLRICSSGQYICSGCVFVVSPLSYMEYVQYIPIVTSLVFKLGFIPNSDILFREMECIRQVE